MLWYWAEGLQILRRETDMKRPALILAAIAALAMFAPLAKADTLTLTPAQLAGLAYSAAGTVGGWTSLNVAGTPACSAVAGGVGCAGMFLGTAVGEGTMVFHIGGLSLDYLGTDSFGLNIFNNNNATWNFTICLANLAGNQGCFGGGHPNSFPIAVGVGQDFTGLLGGPNGTITDVWIVLTANLPNVNPNGRADHGPDFIVTPVPEPGTLALFGIGAALAGIRRKMQS